ncbi:MAG: SDR family NAD(P)-dependent oxidoreductase [Candidatus Jordarchaeum sp.]|uniref:SDR family NAD(P)-dependent oxidoreductase n=1 Tax=Candidatus Jordarchaeum sp. TaxID=2823881 RepID=UPI0040490503
MGRLDGKIAAVTGAASGIGLEISRRFLSEGASVLLADINEANLEKAFQESSQQYAGRVHKIKADVTKSKEVDNFVQETVNHFGRIDIIVNCAGILKQCLLQDLDDATWDESIKIMLYGVFYGVRAGARQMIAQGKGGCIINISSVGGIVPLSDSPHYCVAKSGVNMLTKVAAVTLGKHKIRVNAIAPGETWTPMTEAFLSIPGVEDLFIKETPLERLGKPSDVASVALFLASDESDWITGHVLCVDGGQGLRGVDAEKIFQ